MYKNKIIAVIVPCFNEEYQISPVINSIPDYIDRIVIIDDHSKDKTVEIVKTYQAENEKIILLLHDKNQGVGGAIATGYKWAQNNNIDVAVVMAGDGQMAPEDLSAILDPVVNDDADYSKGNRLFTGEAYKKIPKLRYFGNSLLSLFTKIASGYWHIADSQSGYTAINQKMLQTIDWDKMYKRYGQPNDLLVRLNIVDARVRDVRIKPVYGIGEQSGIKIHRVVFTISWLLLKRFIWRIKKKYIIRDFHPLVFFYLMGFLFGLATAILSVRLVVRWYIDGYVPAITALSTMFSFMSSSLFTLFAMWFDMESNKHLK